MDKKEVRDRRKKKMEYKKKYKGDKSAENENKNSLSNEPDKVELQEEQKEIPLANNWSRYEIENDNDNDTTKGANFEMLLHESSSNDSYFKFKSEQNWNSIESQQLSKHFTLDLKQLNEGIASIPFHLRHDFDKNLFPQSDIETFKKNSENNRKKYNTYLEKKNANNKSNLVIKETFENSNLNKKADEIINDKKEAQISEKEPEIPERESIILAKIEKPQENIVKKEISDEDAVTELINASMSSVSFQDNEIQLIAQDPLLETNIANKLAIPNSTMDLEQWLDDILDD